MARYTYMPVDKYSFFSNMEDQKVNATKTRGRGHCRPEVTVLYLLCPVVCKEKGTSLIRKALVSRYAAKAPTSTSLTVAPSEPSLICRALFFARGALFGLDSLQTGCLGFLGTFFWGSQALSSLSSSSEADDLGINCQKKF